MGEPIVRRVYGKAASIPRWAELAGFRLVHSSGKESAADMALAIDAVDLWRSGAFDAAFLVTSDGDFSHLAIWLREHGASVIGMGEAKAPDSFRDACERFEPLGELTREPAVATSDLKNDTDRAGGPGRNPAPTDIDHQIRRIIEVGSKGRQGIPIAALNTAMQRVALSFRVAELHAGKWRGYLMSKPDLYELDPCGPEAKVRFLWSGFNAASGAPSPRIMAPPLRTCEGRPPDSPDARPHTIQ